MRLSIQVSPTLLSLRAADRRRSNLVRPAYRSGGRLLRRCAPRNDNIGRRAKLRRTRKSESTGDTMHWTPRRERFRALLAGNRCVHTGSVYDAISARIAEDLGFEVGI